MSSDDDEHVITVAPRAVARRTAVDAIARARYLEVLSKTGSHAAASAAARPHLHTKRSAMQTMERHIAANATFAAQVNDVLANVSGRLDEEIINRALNGKVVYQKKNSEGDVLEEKIDYDNNLLLKVARQVGKRIDPNAWAPEDKRIVVDNNKTVDVTVNIDNILEKLDSDAIRNLIEATSQAKALSSGDQMEDVEDAEILDP